MARKVVPLRPVDRNGIPVLDPPGGSNKLPRQCLPQEHDFVRVQALGISYGVVRVTKRCSRCGLRIVETLSRR